MERQHYVGNKESSRAYSKAVVTEGGRIAWLAGVVDVDESWQPIKGSFEESTHATFARLRESVEAVGGSLADIVTMTVWITDDRFGDEFVRLRNEYFEPGKHPASALITCAALAHPDLRLEIQAVAVIDD